MKYAWLITMTVLIILSNAQAQDCSWTGTWSTTAYGSLQIWNMTLQQSGNKVTGTYEPDNGTIDGTIDGIVLRGTWTEGPNSTGPFEFNISPDCKEFHGNFAFDFGGSWSGRWDGKRTSPYGDSTTGTITGKVVDSTTNQLLEGVLVLAGSTGEAYTDRSGSYTLKGVPAGLATIEAQKEGYDSQTKTVDVIVDKTAVLDFSLDPYPKNPSPPIMTPTPEEFAEWIKLYEDAPNAPGTISSAPGQQQDYTPGDYKGDSFSLLPYLQYDANERQQGFCSDCWQWAGTAVMEIQLAYRNDIKDRLSVEYINSNIASSIDCKPCCGGWLDYLAKFYADRDQAVPWTNSNADWKDGRSECGSSVVPPDSTATSPAYSITSIRTEKIPTHGVGVDTAKNNIKNVLRQGKAVWFAFALPNSNEWDKFYYFWYNQREDVVYPIDAANGIPITTGFGAHAVVIVGYDDTDPNNRYWIVLNSWGTSNGLRPGGLFRIDMDMNYDCKNPGINDNHALYFETLDITYDVQRKKSSRDLTGVWSCDDGGTYYLRQLENVLWWDGDDPNGAWANVAYGTIDGNTITLEYADVPEGRANGFGKLVLNVVSNDELEAREKPRSYGGSRWWRGSEREPPKPPIPPEPTDTDPWNDPAVRSLIDEWLQQQDKCIQKVSPGLHYEKWGTFCGESETARIQCGRKPDTVPAGWDSYQYIWVENWCPEYYPYRVQDYAKLRQSGFSFDDLAECKGKNDRCN